jgi:hypothetical protein
MNSHITWQKLKRLTLIKLEQTSAEKHEKIVNFEETILRTNNLIKYLHSHVRFFIDNINDNFSFNVESSFKKSKKFTSNAKILKLFCDISFDVTQNKKWRKKSLYKIKADVFCYFTMLNKKKKKDAQHTKISFYHLTDKFDSRIIVANVWFIQNFITQQTKDKHMKNIDKRHRKWKFRTLFRYIKECEIYILERRNEKFNAMLEIWNKSEIQWLIHIAFFNDLIILTNESLFDDDYVNLVKKKN